MSKEWPSIGSRLLLYYAIWAYSAKKSNKYKCFPFALSCTVYLYSNGTCSIMQAMTLQYLLFAMPLLARPPTKK